MEGAGVIIPVYGKIETALERIRHIRGTPPGGGYEIVAVDNASTHDTRRAIAAPGGIVYAGNDENPGAAAALNADAGAAKSAAPVFMHNDVFAEKEGRVDEYGRFLAGRHDAGVVDLHGAGTQRRDASFRGRSIVRYKNGSPAMRRRTAGATGVAVVDGLPTDVRRETFDAVGGFNEEFPIHRRHRDFPMRAAAAGLKNRVPYIPFKHPCAVTRRDAAGRDDARERNRPRFMALWGKRPPCDVSGVGWTGYPGRLSGQAHNGAG